MQTPSRGWQTPKSGEPHIRSNLRRDPIIGALTRREWYHKTLVVFTNAAFVLYIVLLYERMS
jgi:hypothetical protein